MVRSTRRRRVRAASPAPQPQTPTTAVGGAALSGGVKAASAPLGPGGALPLLDDVFDLSWDGGGGGGGGAADSSSGATARTVGPQRGLARQQQQQAGGGHGSEKGAEGLGASGDSSPHRFLRGLASPPVAGPLAGALAGSIDAPGAEASTRPLRQRPRSGAAAAAQSLPSSALPAVNERTWRAVAAQMVPRLYDASWHSSLAALTVDAWDAALVAPPADAAEAASCYHFLRACVCARGSSAYAQACALLPLAEALSGVDADTLLDEASAGLGAGVLRRLLAPVVVGCGVGGAEARQTVARALERTGDGGGGGGDGDGDGDGGGPSPAAGLLEGVPRLLALRGVYPGLGPSALAHLAPLHGVWPEPQQDDR